MRLLFFLYILMLPLALMAEDPLELAAHALQSQLNLLAKAEYTEVLNQSRDPVLRFRASLGLAKVFIAQGKLDEALALLDQLPQAPNGSDLAESLLIRADIDLLRTKYDAADEILRELPILSGALDLQRKRLQARSLMMQEKYHEGISLLKGDNEIGDLPAVFQLDVAEFFYQSGQTSDALLIWKRLAEGEFALMPTQQALLQLARHSLETENIPQARIYLETLSSGKGLHASLEPEVYPVFIRLLEKEEAYLEAAAYLSAFEKLIKDPIENTRLKALRAQNLIRGGELETARNELQQLIATRGDQVEIARVQLFLIRTFMDLEAFEDVKEACKTYLSVFTDPEGLREAETALASAHEQLSEYRKAELLYEKVYKDAPVDSELRLAMLVKSGDMALAQRNFPVAVERYRLFLDSYPEHARVPQVLIQMSAAIAESGSLNEALNVLRRVRLRYPESPFAEKALIQQAILLQKSQRPEQALGVYDSYLELYPEGDFVADAMTDKGITAYRLGLFDLALRQFKEVSERFPEHPRVEQAQSLTGWTHYLMGEDEAARRVGREFLKKYPKSPYANEVRFWLAEVAFNRGEYPLAAESFQILTSADNPNPLRAKAHYLAGRALMADKKPEQALTEFSAARELDPAAPFAPDVLFFMGDVLTEQGRFDEAILVFDQLIRLHPDSYLVYAARGRMGDCQYTLGERDPSRYLEALNSYKLVEESKEAGMELRLQAMYKVGRTLNALDRAEEARRQLEKMIQQYMLHRNVVGSDAATWFLRAVMDVAQSYEQSAEYRNAIKIYEKLRDSGLPQADEGARRIEALRREQRILF